MGRDDGRMGEDDILGVRLFYFCYIYNYLCIHRQPEAKSKKMNTTSFQSNTYNHLQQTQIHGQSGLKILAGEDLSTMAW